MALDFSLFFSQQGYAGQLFGEFWVFVLLIIFIFALFLYIYGLNGKEISFFVFFALMYISIENLFEFSNVIVQSIVVLIILFVGYYAYKFFSK